MDSDTDISSDIPPDKENHSPVDEDDVTIQISKDSAETTKSTSEVSLLGTRLKQLEITSSGTSIVKRTKKISCKYPLCKDVSSKVIVCGECSANIHYKCSKLPAYQLHRFLTARNYRKFVCEFCCGHIPAEIAQNYIDTSESLDTTLCNASIQECKEKEYNTLQKLLDEKEHVITQQEAFVKSLMETVENNKNIILDKDDVITKQSDVIHSLKTKFLEDDTVDDKEKAEENHGINDCNLVLEQAQLIASEMNNVNNELRDLLEEEKIKSLNLSKRLDSQIIIAQQAEEAYDAQVKVVDTKDQVINYQKITIDNLNTILKSSEAIETHNYSEDPGQEMWHNPLNNLNAVIINSLLVWVDIQRLTTAENIWKTQAVHNFTPEEISTAKYELWKNCGEDLLGKFIRRQGLAKAKTEVNDICLSFHVLLENDVIPTFVATSAMIRQTPLFNPDTSTNSNDSIVHNIKILEDTISATMNTNKHDALVKRLETLEESIITAINMNRERPTLNGHKNDEHNTPTHINDTNGNEIVGYTWRDVVTKNLPTSVKTPGNENTIENNHRSSNIVKTGDHYKQNRNIHTAQEQNNGNTLNSDIDLVVYGATRGSTTTMVSNWIEDHGIKVLDCVLLT